VAMPATLAGVYRNQCVDGRMAELAMLLQDARQPGGVVNGGGMLEREYAIGWGRMDLCLRYGAVTLGIELKVWRDGEPDPLTEGLEQLDGYLAGLGLESGWLVIFDRRSGQPPIRERTSSEEKQSPQGRRMTVVRA